MKNTLFVFGCSYSSRFEESGINKEYKTYKNGWPKSWPEILSEKLGMNLINKSKGGLCNDDIFERFCIESDKIKKDDIVIIGWSYLDRFRVADIIIKDEWENLSSNSESDNISISTSNEISINRTSFLYENEIHNREKLIKLYSESKGFKVYFWNAGFPFQNQEGYLLNKIEKETPHDTFIQFVLRSGGKKITEETNGIVNDNHLGEMGHIIQANLFYDEIKLTL